MGLDRFTVKNRNYCFVLVDLGMWHILPIKESESNHTKVFFLCFQITIIKKWNRNADINGTLLKKR